MSKTTRELYQQMCSLYRNRRRALRMENGELYDELASAEMVLQLQHPVISLAVSITEQEYQRMDVMMVRKLARQGLAQKRDVLSLRGIQFFKKGE